MLIEMLYRFRVCWQLRLVQSNLFLLLRFLYWRQCQRAKIREFQVEAFGSLENMHEVYFRQLAEVQILLLLNSTFRTIFGKLLLEKSYSEHFRPYRLHNSLFPVQYALDMQLQ